MINLKNTVYEKAKCKYKILRQIFGSYNIPITEFDCISGMHIPFIDLK